LETEELTAREDMAIDTVKKMMRLHDHKFIRNDKTAGVPVSTGGSTIYMDLDGPNKIVKFFVE